MNPSKEQLAQQEYQTTAEFCLLCDYLTLEESVAKRIVFEKPVLHRSGTFLGNSGLLKLW